MDKKSHLLFLDESGHHGLKKLEQEFPIFLLSGCIFEKKYYLDKFTKHIETLKIKHFGSKDIIFHSRDIRKWQREFKILGDINKRKSFYDDFDELVKKSRFTIIAAAINKKSLIKTYGPRADNPYSLYLSFILERTIFFTDKVNSYSLSVFAESRGKKEDSELFSQFQLVLSNGTSYINSQKFNKKIKSFNFVKKKENNIGIQIADMVAYPIATKILFPKRINLAFEVIEDKIYRQFPRGDYLGYGLKIFP